MINETCKAFSTTAYTACRRDRRTLGRSNHSFSMQMALAGLYELRVFFRSVGFGFARLDNADRSASA